MKWTPDLAAIREAELRVAQSSRNVRSSLCRARIALRTTMARPATFLKVAGVAGLFCFWVARRTWSNHPAKGLLGTFWTSALGMALAHILHNGITRLGTLIGKPPACQPVTFEPCDRVPAATGASAYSVAQRK